jgi:hypothetical protein
MNTVLFLSGTTRGGTLEGICRSYAPVLEQMDIELVELSLVDLDSMLARLRGLDISKVLFVLSCAGMGFDLSITSDGRQCNLWQELGLPCITLHGDSPAYFFDRHVVPSNRFISLYAFVEHCELRRTLPRIHGPISTLPPILLDELPREQLDLSVKRSGTLLFLKNGKDPAFVRRQWTTFADPRTLRALFELADHLEGNLDASKGDEIPSVVDHYFQARGFDVQELVKLRLFFIAQLDDYLRAVKCTCMARALMDFPIEIRGNNWDHLDFTGKRATYIDDCNYVDSTTLIRRSLGLIDMSPNTASGPHDRVMRAYGSHTLCLTNARQTFLEDLPLQEELSFTFEQESLQSHVAGLLARKSDAVEMGLTVAERFRSLHPPQRAFQKMLDYAAFSRLDQTRARPTGLQDFFLWPPQLI